MSSVLSTRLRLRRWLLAALAATGVQCSMATPVTAVELDCCFAEDDVAFESTGSTLNGTVLIPEGDDKKPAIVLLGGSGPEKRDKNRKLAEIFANAGVVTFIYDKRTQGYSAEPTGSRSYSLLADDAVAAVQEIQALPYVDAEHVGLWGVSEGAWVAPLAANRSDDVSFVITMGGIGLPPASQVGWSVGQTLRHQGVSSDSMLHALSTNASRFIVSAEIMSEATYNPVPAMEDLRQPYLGLWGDRDAVQPSQQSAGIIAAALERSDNNPSYTLEFIAGADHNGYPTEDGFARTSDNLAPSYIETMLSWISQTTSGRAPISSVASMSDIGAPPAPDATHARGYDLWYVQLGTMSLFVFGFGLYAIVALWRWFKRVFLRRASTSSAASAPVRRYARVVTLGGTALWVYAMYYIFSVYIGSTADSAAPISSTIVGGRTVTWLVLQLSSLALVALAILLAATTWRQRSRIAKSEILRLTSVLVACIAFVPWAIYWQLLVP